MSLKTRLAKLESSNKHQAPRYVVRLIGDESLQDAKIKQGIGHIPDDEIFIIHRVIVKPPMRH